MLSKEVCRKCVHEEYDRIWSSKRELDETFEDLWSKESGFCHINPNVTIRGPFPDKCKYKKFHGDCNYCEERHCNQCELKKG
jgi:hypothetical protein